MGSHLPIGPSNKNCRYHQISQILEDGELFDDKDEVFGEGPTAMNPSHSQSCNVRGGGTLDRQASRKILGNRTNQPGYSNYATNQKRTLNNKFAVRQKSIRLSG